MPQIYVCRIDYGFALSNIVKSIVVWKMVFSRQNAGRNTFANLFWQPFYLLSEKCYFGCCYLTFYLSFLTLPPNNHKPHCDQIGKKDHRQFMSILFPHDIISLHHTEHWATAELFLTSPPLFKICPQFLNYTDYTIDSVWNYYLQS